MPTSTHEVIESLWGVTLDKLHETEEGRRILSCIQCGVCAGTCPYGEYMDWSPRRIIKMLQAGQLEEVFQSDSLLKCVNCYACMEKCPRNIRLTEILLPLIKEQTVLRLPHVPAELQKAVENTYRYGNPMGESGRKRAAWVKTTNVPVRILAQDPRPADVLWFLESDLSYHPRGQDTARATARVFHDLGVDFAILGPEEKSAGDCGRLSWEKGLSEVLIEYNMAIFAKYQFKQIVTSDPHALDAFRYRYTMFGFDYKVTHIVPYVFSYLEQLKPLLKMKLNHRVTYHDSCCLGRHNSIYAEPRALLQAIPGIKLSEMVHNHNNTLCCGGGGGGMWLDAYYKSKGMERLSDRRIQEAIDTGADVLAVACPYEVSRFEDSLKITGYEGKMIVRDILELLAESMGGE
jgi:dimethylglycine catabolism B